MPSMTGKRALMECLSAHGVEIIFGNPGSTESPIMDALVDHPSIRYVLALQETPVVSMADGYARASGRAAFANVHIAPGLANAISQLYNAYRGGTPLILTAGQADSRMEQEEPSLSADLVRMTRQFTKWSAEVSHAADLPMVIRRAFKVALEPPTGPVFISLPWDALDEEFVPDPSDLLPPPEAYRRARPDAAGVHRAATLLAEARQPIVVAGDRLAQSGGMAALVRVAELLGAPVYLGSRSQPVFPTSHPLFAGSIGPANRDVFARADVVLAVGANLFNSFLYTPRGVIPPTTRLIQLDSSAWEVGRVYAAEVGLVADPRAGLEDLADALEEALTRERRDEALARVARARAERSSRREDIARRARDRWDAVPIAPARLAIELRARFPENGLLVEEAITTSAVLHQAFDFSSPGEHYSHRGGAIGWGPGGAVGVQLARPERRVVAVIGDGSSAYSFQALWTAAHLRLPMTYVICSNRSYRILKVNLARYRGEQATGPDRFLGMDLNDPPIDFARLAEGFGVQSRRVERPADLGPALAEAFQTPGPSLVDVVIDGSL